MKFSKARKKYLLRKYFQGNRENNIPEVLDQLGCRDGDTTDEDLIFILQYVKEIKKLFLGGNRISREGIKALRDLQRVNYLDLGECPIDADNLDYILHLQGVEYLYVKHTGIYAHEMKRILTKFENLTNLVGEIRENELDLLDSIKIDHPNCVFEISTR